MMWTQTARASSAPKEGAHGGFCIHHGCDQRRGVPSRGLPQWLSRKESTFNAGDLGSIPRSSRSPGGEPGNPLQCSRPPRKDTHTCNPLLWNSKTPAVVPGRLRCEAPFYHLLESPTSLGLHLETPPWASQVVLVVKNPPAKVADARDTGSIPGLGRSPGGGNCNPLLYSCLENPMDRGTWRATVHGVTESDTTEHLSAIPHRVHRRTHQMPHGQRLHHSPEYLLDRWSQASCSLHLSGGCHHPRTSLSCLAPPGAPSLPQTGGGLVISSNPCPQGQEWGRPLFSAPFLQE